MKQTIIAYLSGPRNYNAGVALYETYGVNRMLKSAFRKGGETALNKQTLYEELRKLAGISEVQFKLMKQQANICKPVVVKPVTKKEYDDETLMKLAEKFGVTVDELLSDDIQERILSYYDNQDKIDELEEHVGNLEDENIEKEALIDEVKKDLEKAKKASSRVSDTTMKVIRFREKFPFLNEQSCPDILKILVADMFTAYSKYREAHSKLVELPDNADIQEAAALSENIVEKFLENREYWDELEYYKDNNAILGKCSRIKDIEVKLEYSSMSDADLIKARANASSNVSKNKKKLIDEKDEVKIAEINENLAKWEHSKAMLEQEIENRKK